MFENLFKKKNKGEASSETKASEPLPYYKAREKVQKNYLNELLQRNDETWSYDSGDYRSSMEAGQDFFVDSPEKGLEKKLEQVFVVQNEIQLKENELVLAAFILDAVRAKKKIRVVDAGGMSGLSWMRLAIYFEEYVKSGLVELIVSNLTYDPLPMIEEIRSKMNDALDPQLKTHYQMYLRGYPLVKFVHATTDTLRETVGPADVIFEQFAASHHSTIPAVERERLFNALNPGGVLLADKITGIRHDRYRQILDAAGQSGFMPMDFEEVIKAEREKEVEDLAVKIDNTPDSSVIKELTILNEKVPITGRFFMAQKSKSPLVLLS